MQATIAGARRLRWAGRSTVHLFHGAPERRTETAYHGPLPSSDGGRRPLTARARKGGSGGSRRGGPLAIVVRYPGRACLLGEHTDWAGGASLAVPLPQGVEVTVEEPAGPGLLVRSALDGRLLAGRFPTDGAVDVDGGPLRFVGAAAFALTEMGVDIPPAELWVTADLPAGRGFSSSAAFNLAILDALARHAGHPLPAATLAGFGLLGGARSAGRALRAPRSAGLRGRHPGLLAVDPGPRPPAPGAPGCGLAPGGGGLVAAPRHQGHPERPAGPLL